MATATPEGKSIRPIYAVAVMYDLSLRPPYRQEWISSALIYAGYDARQFCVDAMLRQHHKNVQEAA